MPSWRSVGELGAAEGPALAYNWTAQGLVAPLLPWLAILVLLALRPNRGWSAWWIWLPLACLAAVWHYAPAVLARTPADAVSVLVDIPRALAFGVAALWLLAPPAGRGNRLGRCLRTFLVLAAFGAFSFAVAGGWDEGAGARLRGLPGGGWPHFAVWAGSTAQLLLLAALALILALATALTSLVWRSGRFLRLCLSLLWILPAVTLTAAAVAFFAGGKSLSVPGMIAALSFLNLLPFLALSAANAWFRQRLQAALQVTAQRPAPAPPVQQQLLVQ